MLTFAIPIFFSNLFQQLYNAVDSLIVGNFIGEDALAAVGSSGSLIFLLTGFVNGVSLGAGVLVARYFGAKDDAALKKAVHTTVALGIAAGLALTVVGVLLTPQILRWMGTPENVMDNLGGLFPRLFYGLPCGGAVQRGRQHSAVGGRQPQPHGLPDRRLAAQCGAGSCVCGGAGHGRRLGGLCHYHQPDRQRLAAFRKLGRAAGAYAVRWREVRFDGPTLRAVVAQGLPSGVQNSVISLANVIVQANINAFGSQAMAGCAAYSKVEGFAFLPVTCFSMALATFVSQNVGAGQYDRVRKGMRFGILTSVTLAEVVGVLIFTLSPFLIGLFNDQPNVVVYGVRQAHHRRAVLLPAGVQPLLRRHPAGAGPARCAHGHHAGGVVRAAHLLHHRHGPADPGHRRHLLAYPLTWAVSGVLFAWYLAHAALPSPGGGAPQQKLSGRMH